MVSKTKFWIPVISNTEKLFLTQATYTGNLGGTAGADDKCATDLNNPGGIFKALLGNNDRSLHPISMDWVTAPHVEYYEAFNNLFVTKTNDRGIFNLIKNSFERVPNGFEFWTGLDENTWAVSANNCGNWKSSESTFLGDASDPTDWSITADTCDQMRSILCIEL